MRESEAISVNMCRHLVVAVSVDVSFELGLTSFLVSNLEHLFWACGTPDNHLLKGRLPSVLAVLKVLLGVFILLFVQLRVKLI